MTSKSTSYKIGSNVCSKMIWWLETAIDWKRRNWWLSTRQFAGIYVRKLRSWDKYLANDWSKRKSRTRRRKSAAARCRAAAPIAESEKKERGVHLSFDPSNNNSGFLRIGDSGFDYQGESPLLHFFTRKKSCKPTNLRFVSYDQKMGCVQNFGWAQKSPYMGRIKLGPRRDKVDL